jgi:F-type H+-transporting ATPase subunit alpha
MTNSYGELEKNIVASGDWNKDIEAQFKQIVSEFKTTGSW